MKLSATVMRSAVIGIAVLPMAFRLPVAAQNLPQNLAQDVSAESQMALCEQLEADGSQLLSAAQVGDVEKVRSLLTCGVDLNTLTPWRENFSLDEDSSPSVAILNATPLHAAAWNGHADVVETLIVNGADVNLLDEWGLSVLTTAAESGQATVVAQLLAAGADVNFIADCDECINETALTLAADRGHVEVVRILLAAGADTTHSDREGYTALEAAILNEHTQVVELLRNAEAQ